MFLCGLLTSFVGRETSGRRQKTRRRSRWINCAALGKRRSPIAAARIAPRFCVRFFLEADVISLGFGTDRSPWRTAGSLAENDACVARFGSEPKPRYVSSLPDAPLVVRWRSIRRPQRQQQQQPDSKKGGGSEFQSTTQSFPLHSRSSLIRTPASPIRPTWQSGVVVVRLSEHVSRGWRSHRSVALNTTKKTQTRRTWPLAKGYKFQSKQFPAGYDTLALGYMLRFMSRHHLSVERHWFAAATEGPSHPRYSRYLDGSMRSRQAQQECFGSYPNVRHFTLDWSQFIPNTPPPCPPPLERADTKKLCGFSETGFPNFFRAYERKHSPLASLQVVLRSKQTKLKLPTTRRFPCSHIGLSLPKKQTATTTKQRLSKTPPPVPQQQQQQP
jgi:hypothetical protein